MQEGNNQEGNSQEGEVQAITQEEDQRIVLSNHQLSVI